jgi:GT2 family glycosyltransferase
LLFLAPDVLPRGPGWLGQLIRAIRANERAGLVSPTLLYEDDSIRFAGMPLDAVGDAAAVPSGPGRYSGYPRNWLTETEPTEVLAGTSECCLLPRRLFEQVGGFARDLVGGAQQDMALGLRLRDAGRSCLWVPSVALYAVDPAARTATPTAGVDIARLVDDWSFARTWERHRDRHAAGTGQ